MSEFVKLDVKSSDQVKVDLGMFEQITNGQPPWSARDERTGKIKRFGLCPECENPMQLINIDNPSPSKIPHRRHSVKPVLGFRHCLEKILSCDLFDPSKKEQIKAENKLLTLDAIERRAFLVNHFNLAVGILQEDIGIAISNNLADKILETWFEDHWYRWTYATLGNLPWLFGRTTKAHSLYGQVMRPSSDVCRAILSAVPEAMLGEYNRLIARPGQRFYLEFGLRNHKAFHVAKGNIEETIVFYVVRPSLNSEVAAKVIFEKEIILRSDEFLSRVKHSNEPEGYGLRLIETAQLALDRYLERHPEARAISP